MSRTRNTRPYRIQEAEGAYRFGGFPFAGGMWKGIENHTRKKEKGARKRVRNLLSQLIEPEPTRHRNDAKYNYW